jgi:hypothetical protein
MGSEKFCSPPSLYRTEFRAPSPQQNGRSVNLTTHVLVPCFSKREAAPPLCSNTATANTVTPAVPLHTQTSRSYEHCYRLSVSEDKQEENLSSTLENCHIFPGKRHLLVIKQNKCRWHHVARGTWPTMTLPLLLRHWATQGGTGGHKQEINKVASSPQVPHLITWSVCFD